ncbi:MAG: tRNA (adenosine(37)-N6)-threonylcarbamoyltransferase complex ATPase subunit type 1 TsaE [Phycisphaerae bacterium]
MNTHGPSVEVIARCLDETLALGRRIGEHALPGQCLALEGILGAGKTQLVRGISCGAQVAAPGLVNSPSYVLLNVYEAVPDNPRSKTVYHLDAYRVKNSDEFLAVGLPEILEQDGIVCIEWATRVVDLLPEDYVLVQGVPLDEFTRSWRFTANGPISNTLLTAIIGTSSQA